MLLPGIFHRKYSEWQQHNAKVDKFHLYPHLSAIIPMASRRAWTSPSFILPLFSKIHPQALGKVHFRTSCCSHSPLHFLSCHSSYDATGGPVVHLQCTVSLCRADVMRARRSMLASVFTEMAPIRNAVELSPPGGSRFTCHRRTMSCFVQELFKHRFCFAVNFNNT